MKEIPVYLFTGFLESGKTMFLQETLEDESFNKGEKTLILLCEEGIEELDYSAFNSTNIFVETVENQEALSPKLLSEFEKKHGMERVVIEYNGMWQLDTLYKSLPENWQVYQEMMFIDGSTFNEYNNNMRMLMVDKLTSAETVVFNRLKPGCDKTVYHKAVRAISRAANIIYEDEQHGIEIDEIEDPLPFDINAPVIEIADEDYAYWYRDFSEDIQKYVGKTVKFKALVVKEDKFPTDTFAVGRHIMVCCAEDITYRAFACVGKLDALVTSGAWIVVTAKIDFEFNKIYKGKGPVLKLIEYSVSTKPEQPVATFS